MKRFPMVALLALLTGACTGGNGHTDDTPCDNARGECPDTDTDTDTSVTSVARIKFSSPVLGVTATVMLNNEPWDACVNVESCTIDGLEPGDYVVEPTESNYLFPEAAFSVKEDGSVEGEVIQSGEDWVLNYNRVGGYMVKHGDESAPLIFIQDDNNNGVRDDGENEVEIYTEVRDYDEDIDVDGDGNVDIAAGQLYTALQGTHFNGIPGTDTALRMIFVEDPVEGTVTFPPSKIDEYEYTPDGDLWKEFHYFLEP